MLNTMIISCVCNVCHFNWFLRNLYQCRMRLMISSQMDTASSSLQFIGNMLHSAFLSNHLYHNQSIYSFYQLVLTIDYWYIKTDIYFSNLVSFLMIWNLWWFDMSMRWFDCFLIWEFWKASATNESLIRIKQPAIA
jgi:hypothetical protein